MKKHLFCEIFSPYQRKCQCFFSSQSGGFIMLLSRF